MKKMFCHLQKSTDSFSASLCMHIHSVKVDTANYVCASVCWCHEGDVQW